MHGANPVLYRDLLSSHVHLGKVLVVRDHRVNRLGWCALRNTHLLAENQPANQSAA